MKHNLKEEEARKLSERIEEVESLQAQAGAAE